jgi:16S rRNA (uracil1498-N3)-methyltransferase
VDVTVLCALPKGDKADTIVQKCTEAGASRIVFFMSHRCVAKLPSDPQKKVARWQKIAEEAAKQSGRGRIPEVTVLGDIGSAYTLAKESDLPVFLYETGERKALKEILEGASGVSSIALITGPEGGFEPFEAEMASYMGIPLCSMGPRIFRCETAPLAALAAVMYATGNL